ncbi:hypothetical protein HJC23_003668 [Cyclotella cryptica]|uniref:CP12 domain-containing protein n=1 Tax=Cyclotella cryptica TaxID=29204 RepID=A0ABD3QJQ3_9STRA|eukprot:CCRYP_004961-RA/>CCRYP_004961-RA protein AED:0.02 eAED:0.02 QI:113/1/0.5/1/0.33/0.25/4/1912/201
MKFLTLALLASYTSAFAPVPLGKRAPTSHFSRADSSAAVEAALEASKKYGATSAEARVLWDIVEEMDASDNSAAYQAPVLDAEYEAKVKALSQMLSKTKAELDEVKQLADELKGVKLASPSVSASAPDDSAMKEALSAARDATKKFGMESVDAKLAWETVEEVAASTSYSAIRAPLDEECLIELIEGCEALEKFKAALDSR